MRTNTTQLLNSLVIIGITLLTLGVLIPQQSVFNIGLGTYAQPLMLGCLATGLLAFVWRNNQIIITSFMACIVLCTFLKDQGQAALAVNQLTSSDYGRLSVAHLILNTPESIQDFEAMHQQLDVNFISIQTGLNEVVQEKLVDTLAAEWPFWEKRSYGNGQHVFIFSSYALSNVDTIYNQLEQQMRLRGTIHLDDERQIISFLNIPQTPSVDKHFHVVGRNLSPQTKHQVAHITPHKTSKLKEQMLYSKDLVCVGSNKILNGSGILATYQLRPTESIPTDFETYFKGLNATL